MQFWPNTGEHYIVICRHTDQTKIKKSLLSGSRKKAEKFRAISAFA